MTSLNFLLFIPIIISYLVNAITLLYFPYCLSVSTKSWEKWHWWWHWPMRLKKRQRVGLGHMGYVQSLDLDICVATLTSSCLPPQGIQLFPLCSESLIHQSLQAQCLWFMNFITTNRMLETWKSITSYKTVKEYCKAKSNKHFN